MVCCDVCSQPVNYIQGKRQHLGKDVHWLPLSLRCETNFQERALRFLSTVSEIPALGSPIGIFEQSVIASLYPSVGRPDERPDLAKRMHGDHSYDHHAQAPVSGLDRRDSSGIHHHG